MKSRNSSICALLPLFFAGALSCATIADKLIETENQRFLKDPYTRGEDRETFRVLIMSDRYVVVQTDHQDTIERQDDPGGDRYICDEVKRYDKIDESREGMYHISLFPDRGKLRRLRPYKSLNLIELDSLVIDDLQRWNFKFPRQVIQPSNLYIKYRVVLRKKQTDEQIIKEVQEKMKGDE